MFIRRIRNLWKLSGYRLLDELFPIDLKKGESITLELSSDFKKGKIKRNTLATIIQDDPKEMFEGHEENV